ncbi:MAG TPA: ATP-binding cassette domain-containing protein [Pseudonocardiaceae bacterium]|jgi:ABC-2 type transport system ATP-binding protein|nr:ATP-binding cassette domain-containing protein [Pseudonocardiaceae bacterium]
MQDCAIVVEGLVKRFGEVKALAGIDFTVRRGSILAVLGHNGAGKTSLIDILSTRAKPTAGHASVCGFDVVRSAKQVRRRIGVTGQFAALDDAVSARENLVVLARLLGADRQQARTRADELLDLFDLTAYADRPARLCSGGLRRRLDLAASLVGTPQVLFLDEPSTGLDPVSRSGLWETVAALAGDGTTVVVTTQYLEEADRLADEVIVLGLGHITLAGTPAHLKSQLGSQVVSLTVKDSLDADRLLGRITEWGLGVDRPTALTITVAVTGPADIVGLVRITDAESISLSGFTVTEPSLDDVYRSVHRSMVVAT